MKTICLRLGAAASITASLLACSTPTPTPTPSTDTNISTGAARPGAPVAACAALAQGFAHADTRIVSVETIAADTLKLPGIAQAMPEHCRVVGRLRERTGAVDGKPYAIGFEMRLPLAWNGRLFYQANGGLDGFLTPAYGDTLGGGPRSNGLLQGYAVISSDAGHLLDRAAGAIGGGVFGVDPQARLDYGYQAVPALTDMARALITAHYGRPPDRAYLVGSSNGGRHGFVAADRDLARFDGVLVTTPGWRLPRAAVAQVWGAQQFARAAPLDPKTQRPDLAASYTPAQLKWVADRVLARCDALDGLADGIVSDVLGCQRAFDAQRDLPECSAGQAANCLSAAQKHALAAVYAGPRLRDGAPFYASLPWDAGISGDNWREWKFVNSVGPRDAVALAFVFSTPPESPAVVNGLGTSLIDYALSFDIERDSARLFAKDARYTESAMDFMTPPDGALMKSFVARGGKLIVAHGSSDPVFSALDSVAWYEAFRQQHGAAAHNSARLYLVPGMNHSRGGPATDQFDLLSALVAWTENGRAPQAIVATARGAGANIVNAEVPAGWSANRTRLLCPHPQVARYNGSGDSESASAFTCR